MGEDDKENFPTTNLTPTSVSSSMCNNMTAGGNCFYVTSPTANAGQVVGCEHSTLVRRPSNRGVDEDVSESTELTKRERRLRKELRLERRMRRRAEEAVATVWWNTLLAVCAVSLCVIGIVALSVAFSRR